MSSHCELKLDATAQTLRRHQSPTEMPCRTAFVSCISLHCRPDNCTAGASRVEREILLVLVLLSPNLADFSSPAVGRAAPGAAKPNKPRMPAAVRHEMDDEDRKKQDMGGKGAKKRGGQEEEEDNSRMQVCFPLPSTSRRSTLPLSRSANHFSFPSTPSSFL